MGDEITDFPENDVPPIPLKTYQWEDIRRQKLEGRYPWTHLYKPPFDSDKWAEIKEHEYEPVIPMDSSIRKTPPLPTLRITTEKENSIHPESKPSESVQDQRHLCVPESEESDEEDSDDENNSEEITTEELQHRLEERYFRSSSPNHTKFEYEMSETRSVSPAFSNRSQTKSETSLRSQDQRQTQTDRIKQRFKNFKEQISREHRNEGTPRMKRKNEFTSSTKKPKQAKKNKFNFRKHNVKSQEKTVESKSTSELDMSAPPQTSRRRFSLPRLPSFSRSRSSSVKERERKRSQSSENESRKFFDFSFGTYPRIFNSCKSRRKSEIESSVDGEVKPKSAPSTPSARRRSPFPQRCWKFHERKKVEKPKKETTKTKKEDIASGTVVTESIFISLHEDPVSNAPQAQKVVTNEFTKPEPKETEEAAPTKMEIDNKNFIFISLHEERFPEKLKQVEEEKHKQQMTEEEVEVEKELQQAKTTRKFHIMLQRLQNDRKMKAGKAAATGRDDKPEPVIITEVTDEFLNQSNLNLSSDIEQPEDEEVNEIFVIDDVLLESYRPENSDDCIKMGPVPQPKILDEGINCEPPSQRSSQVPQKTPRKKLKNSDPNEESKESRDDSVFTNVSEQQQCPREVMTKTYINADLEEAIQERNSVEPEQTTRYFKEYEKALEKSRSQSSFEIENNYYSRKNSLARLETPVPPARPSRIYTMARKKKQETAIQSDNKENYYDLDANDSYNTFPMVKPDKPSRKFRKKRTYSNSTTNTEIIKNMDEIEDKTINNNIVNAKQLSVSFLPLTSNDVGEPIIEYNLRETSSMIHLNLSAEPPLPPKRRKNPTSAHGRFHSLPNQRGHLKNSSTPSEIANNSCFQIDTEIEFADDVNSTAPTDTPPRPPYRKRDASLPDDDRTSREVESLPSEKSLKNYAVFNDNDSRTTNEYAIIGAPKSRRESKIDPLSMSRRISRRVSDFFTLPRIKSPTNYVPPSSQTLDHRRLPSPSRPPRRNRPNHEHVYTNNENTRIDFSEEEHLNFNLATEDKDVIEWQDLKSDPKSLETYDIFEKMKTRPLPPPPRPIRKPRDDDKAGYSQCFKKKPNNDDTHHNDCNGEEKSSNIPQTTTSTWSSWERRTTVREFEIGRDGERREISTPISQTETKKEHTIVKGNQEPSSTVSSQQTKNEEKNECPNMVTRSKNSELTELNVFGPTSVTTPTSQSTDVYPSVSTSNKHETGEDAFHVITAAKLKVSELNVGRMNVSEIDSSRLVTSNIESSSIQVNDDRTETGHVLMNSMNGFDCMSVPEPANLVDGAAIRETTPLSNVDIESVETASIRSRFSSMVPEIGSDEECCAGSAVFKAPVVRPARRKHQVQKRDDLSVPRSPVERNHATLAELMCQILRICYSSIGEALNSLLELVIPEDREKRNEVQAAIWVITIIVAGCLMLGLQSNEKVVHHHHWDFHFPPPQ